MTLSWPDLFANCRNVDEMYRCFLQILTKQIFNHVPLCNKRCGKGWSKSIKKLKNEQKRLHRKIKSHREETDILAYKKLSKKYDIKLSKMFERMRIKLLLMGKTVPFGHS